MNIQNFTVTARIGNKLRHYKTSAVSSIKAIYFVMQTEGLTLSSIKSVRPLPIK